MTNATSSYCIPISVKGIVFENDKVWLRKNERNEWELPGGKLDEGEQPEQTIIREMREELGFETEIIDIIHAHLYTIARSTDEGHGVLVVSYACRTLKRVGEFEREGEAGTADFQAFAMQEVPCLNMPDFYKGAILAAWHKGSTQSMKKGVDYIGVAAGVIVFNNEGKILLAKRGPLARNEKGRWEFPGGAVEFNETCEDAAIREAKEELDITIEILELLEATNHIILEERQHWVSPSYIARHVSGEPTIMEPGKLDEVRWVALSDIDQRSLTSASVSNLVAYIKKYGTEPPKSLNENTVV
ncbi:MAG: NUDIX domain-containing protein [Patescibacteria group bacterium]